MKFKNMFSPIQIGPMTVKNRFVVPPMGNNFANTDGTWSDESVATTAEHMVCGSTQAVARSAVSAAMLIWISAMWTILRRSRQQG